ncbi:unnamed protein product, partial [Prorocentrum cordatum]
VLRWMRPVKSYVKLGRDVWDLVKSALSQSSRDRVQYARAKDAAAKAMVALQEQQVVVLVLEKELAAAKEEAAKALGASIAPPQLDLGPLSEQLKQLQAGAGQGTTVESVFGEATKVTMEFAKQQQTAAAPEAVSAPPSGGAQTANGAGAAAAGAGATDATMGDVDAGFSDHLQGDEPGGLLAGAASPE